MSIGEKLTKIAENEQKVYDKGYEQGIADQKAEGVNWDAIQDYGNRRYYRNAFAYWGCKDIAPKYDVILKDKESANSMFQGCTKLETVDWSKFHLTNVSDLYTTFNNCYCLQNIDTDLATTNTVSAWTHTFSGCKVLKNIQKIVAQVGHTWNSTFLRCYELADIKFAPYNAANGIGIGNDISFADSPKLTRESIESICMALAPVEGKTLTFSADLNLDGKLRETVLGLGVRPYSDGAVKTTEGITFTSPENAGITITGTGTDIAWYYLLNEPITISTGYGGVEAYLDDFEGTVTPYLHMIVAPSGDTDNLVWYDAGSNIYLNDGDVIQAVYLAISPDIRWDNQSCFPVLMFNHKYFLIDENSNGAKYWNIIY